LYSKVFLTDSRIGLLVLLRLCSVKTEYEVELADMGSRKSVVLVPSFSPPQLQFLNRTLSSGQLVVLFKKVRQLLPVCTHLPASNKGLNALLVPGRRPHLPSLIKQFCTFSALLFSGGAGG
jgi:hypothetical protein